MDASLGRYSSRTRSQSTPPKCGSKCLSFTVLQTLSKDWRRSSAELSPLLEPPGTSAGCFCGTVPVLAPGIVLAIPLSASKTMQQAVLNILEEFWLEEFW